MSLGRLYRTLRPLKARQLASRLARHLRAARAPDGPTPAQCEASAPWTVGPVRALEWLDERSVRILHSGGTVDGPADWQRAFGDRLRLYHLHYLDQLRSPDPRLRGFNAKLLARWCADNPRGTRPGWEPYPISRRLVNAIAFLLQGGEAGVGVVSSLAAQARSLARNLETDLLANHLLANAKALVFAGCFFADAEAADWYARGRRILEVEIAEQLLPDGGHFERSPMYHNLVLADLLDLVNLGRSFGDHGLTSLASACRRMLAWSERMRHPDGDIPLFNDSALGIAPPFAELSRYAGALAVDPVEAPSGCVTELRASGFARLESGAWCALLDCGGPGPAYQPGHAHAGTLGFELSYRGERVLVDSGVSTYEAGARRAQERSTRAHNTVALDGRDSSEVWHAFRVGRRARVRDLSTGSGSSSCWVDASHDGYRHTRYRAHHRRHWLLRDVALAIDDELEGTGAPTLSLALHLHPSCQAEISRPDAATIRTASGARLALRLAPELSWRVEAYQYAPSFGVCENAVVIRGEARLPLPRRLRTEFMRDPGG
jgi:uncharacterized heparinase superfamily protein